jgi:hypothetical protein
LLVHDQVLSIDGTRMDGYSLQEAMKLVQEADNVIEMEIMFNVKESSPPTLGSFEVHLDKKVASLNLGITINGSRSRGDTIWISSLKKGGIAYRSGMLHSGDVILAINGQSLENCNLREAAQMLMATGESVTLRVGKESSLPAANNSAASQPIIYSVELHRNQQSLGITLTGNQERQGHPVVISKIKEDGVAYKTGALKVGDRILAINGESLYNKTMPEAVCMLNSAGDVVNLKISKASRKKLKHKSGSPTGRHRREYGFPILHRESFGSSSGSSFVGSNYWGPRSLNYRMRNSFEPILVGESASGCNTPDDVSLVSSIPPVRPSYAAHLPGSAGSRRMGNHTPLSEVSAGTFVHHPGSGVSGANAGYTQPNMWQSPVDDDQMSSVSKQSLYHHLPSHLPSYSVENRLPHTLQHMLKRHISGGTVGVMASKRDSSTDDEMSSYEAENRGQPRYRRSSLPLERAFYSQQPSPQYHTREPHGEGSGMVWDFKVRGRSQKTPIPVGRVSPITPSETEKAASVQEVKAVEEEVKVGGGGKEGGRERGGEGGREGGREGNG